MFEDKNTPIDVLVENFIDSDDFTTAFQEWLKKIGVPPLNEDDYGGEYDAFMNICIGIGKFMTQHEWKNVLRAGTSLWVCAETSGGIMAERVPVGADTCGAELGECIVLAVDKESAIAQAEIIFGKLERRKSHENN